MNIQHVTRQHLQNMLTLAGTPSTLTIDRITIDAITPNTRRCLYIYLDNKLVKRTYTPATALKFISALCSKLEKEAEMKREARECNLPSVSNAVSSMSLEQSRDFYNLFIGALSSSVDSATWNEAIEIAKNIVRNRADKSAA